jgi:hypothetical protein
MPYCQYCGFAESDKYCGQCGRPQGDNPPRPDVDYEKIEQEMKNMGDPELGGEKILFQGTTWPHLLFSPMFCSLIYWRVSNHRIDWDHGCCKAHTDTIDMRRVKDLSFRRNFFQAIAGRGTIIIYADAEASSNEVKLSKVGARKLYLQLKKALSHAKSGISG